VTIKLTDKLKLSRIFLAAKLDFFSWLKSG